MEESHQSHLLDLKFPLGGLLAFCGVVLCVYGSITGGDEALYQKSLGINVNLIWGIVVLIVGSLFVVFSFLRKPQ